MHTLNITYTLNQNIILAASFIRESQSSGSVYKVQHLEAHKMNAFRKSHLEAYDIKSQISNTSTKQKHSNEKKKFVELRLTM